MAVANKKKTSVRTSKVRTGSGAAASIGFFGSASSRRLFIVFAVLFGLVGTYFIYRSSALTAPSWACGSRCNGIGASQLVSSPSGMIRCSDTATIIAQGPVPDAFGGDVDTDMHFIARVSTKCNTMWVTVKNTGTSPLSDCTTILRHVSGYTWTAPQMACPKSGQVAVTPMVDAVPVPGGAKFIIKYFRHSNYFIAEIDF